MRNSLYSVTLSEAFESVGGHHKYQFLVFLQSFSVAFAYSIAFSVFSSLPTGVSLSYRVGIPLGGLIAAFGDALVLRRKLIVWTNATIGVLLLSDWACPWPYAAEALATACGALETAAVLFSAVNLIETVDGKVRSVYVASMFIAGLVGMMTSTQLANSLLELQAIGLISAAVSGAQSLWLLESPRLLAVIAGKYAAARDELQRVAAINGRPTFRGVLEGEKVIGFQERVTDQSESPGSTGGKFEFFAIDTGVVSVSQRETIHVNRLLPWHVFTIASIRMLFLIGLLTLCSLISLYWTMETDWDEVETGINAAVLLITAMLENSAGRMSLSVVFLIVISLSSITSAVLDEAKCHSPAICRLLQLAKSCFFYSAQITSHAEVYALTLFLGESFPTAIRLPALSLIFALAALWMLVSPLALQELAFNPALLCACALLVTALSACVLDDCNPDELSDYVAEEKAAMQLPSDLSQVNVFPSEEVGSALANPS